MTDDAELLRRYAAERSEEAFAELVQRHLNLVYRSALRQLGGDAHRAEDVAQSVFALLAHKAASLSGHPNLAGWLYTTTHLTATVGGGTATTFNVLHLMSTTKTIAIVATAVAVGIGAYWLEHERGLAGPLATKAELARTLQENRRLQAEIARLAVENGRLANQRPAPELGKVAPDLAAISAANTYGPLERLHTLIEFQQKELAHVTMGLFNARTSKLDQNFAEIFNLTPAEMDTLQNAIDQAHQQAGQLMAANATVTRRADGTVVVSVPPLDAGASIQKGLMDAFEQTLGPERDQAFLALVQSKIQNPIQNELGGFGTKQLTITLTYIASPGGNRTLGLIREELGNPANGEGTFVTMMPMIPATYGPFPVTLSWALPLLPPDF
jgi:hypothetical protein